jgi:hypothetical protein
MVASRVVRRARVRIARTWANIYVHSLGGDATIAAARRVDLAVRVAFARSMVDVERDAEGGCLVAWLRVRRTRRCNSAAHEQESHA